MMDCRIIARLVAVWAWASVSAAMLPCAVPLYASPPASKAAADPAVEASRLLDLGERYSPAALAKAREYLVAMRAAPKPDAQVQYALALVFVRQHGHKEALELLDEMLAKQPDALHLWRAKIWTEMATHKEHEALADVRSVADVLAGRSPAELPAADAAAWRTTADFLGRVFGFLEIPRPKALPAEEVRNAKQYLLTRLGDDRTGFNQSQELVAEKFANARAALEDLRAKRVTAGKSKQEALDQQKKVVDEAETNVDYDTQRVASNTVGEVDRHNQSAESLQKYLVACQFRLDAVHKAILMAQDALYQQAFASEQTAQGITSGRFSLVTMARNSQDIQNSLARLTAEENILIDHIKQLSAQLQTTIAQRNALLDTGVKTAAELQTQAANLKRDERRLERAGQVEAKKIAAERQKTFLTKQTSFATFEPFPFETEKQRALGTANP
jgi:hypothetical protein